ncbi:hypothetical protein BEI_2413 [Halomonas beimenensis]|uniref:Uncharacterized protein n=1 Tax=Halomonas beimenensis TaxID=475662 RepID=A0A291P935_9GAMM|nr:hypothetical protein BEI_2413 [Halomonas beimenensis]
MMTGYFDDGTSPGRSNWLLARPLRMSSQATNIMSLSRPTKLHGHEPHAYPERHTG